MGLVAATAMSITVVVGAGLLALPGLSFQLAGRLGFIPWGLVAIMMVPLLTIFAYFAKHHPSAGGVVAYIRISLGYPYADMAELIVIGTVMLGIPAIALIGSDYLHQSLPHSQNLPVSFIIVSCAYAAGLAGVRLSGALQTLIAAVIVLGVLAITTSFLIGTPTPADITPILHDADSRHGILTALPVILFAYTGWELTAFLAEDLVHPERDMPLSIWISFFIVSALYLFVSWTIATYAQASEAWITTPFIPLASVTFGPLAGMMVGVMATLLIVANVMAAFLSASRALFAAGRDGQLPHVLAHRNKNGQPVIAMTVTWLIFTGVIVMTQWGAMGPQILIQLAGQNFFVLYCLCAIGYYGLHRGRGLQTVIGLSALASVVFMMTLFSLPGLIYCGALAALGFVLAARARTNKTSSA